MALGLLIIPLLILIFILFFVFWIVMLVDAATRKFKEGNDKIAWILVVIFAGIIGALIYYFVIYKKSKSMLWFWITLLGVIVLTMLTAFVIAVLYTVGTR